jgi:hypothetical protein
MNSVPARQEAGMCKDVLKTFLESANQLEREVTEASARDAIAAARTAWASIYDVILLAGGAPPDDMAAFAAALDRCAHLISGKTEHVQAYQRQIGWYRGLIDLYAARGVQGVNEAIEDAFVAANKSSSLPVTFSAPDMHVQAQPG